MSLRVSSPCVCNSIVSGYNLSLRVSSPCVRNSTVSGYNLSLRVSSPCVCNSTVSGYNLSLRVSSPCVRNSTVSGYNLSLRVSSTCVRNSTVSGYNLSLRVSSPCVCFSHHVDAAVRRGPQESQRGDSCEGCARPAPLCEHWAARGLGGGPHQLHGWYESPDLRDGVQRWRQWQERGNPRYWWVSSADVSDKKGGSSLLVSVQRWRQWQERGDPRYWWVSSADVGDKKGGILAIGECPALTSVTRKGGSSLLVSVQRWRQWQERGDPRYWWVSSADVSDKKGGSSLLVSSYHSTQGLNSAFSKWVPETIGDTPDTLLSRISWGKCVSLLENSVYFGDGDGFNWSPVYWNHRSMG